MKQFTKIKFCLSEMMDKLDLLQRAIAVLIMITDPKAKEREAEGKQIREEQDAKAAQSTLRGDDHGCN